MRARSSSFVGSVMMRPSFVTRGLIEKPGNKTREPRQYGFCGYGVRWCELLNIGERSVGSDSFGLRIDNPDEKYPVFQVFAYFVCDLARTISWRQDFDGKVRHDPAKRNGRLTIWKLFHSNKADVGRTKVHCRKYQ